jgi:hypothetical protein
VPIRLVEVGIALSVIVLGAIIAFGVRAPIVVAHGRRAGAKRFPQMSLALAAGVWQISILKSHGCVRLLHVLHAAFHIAFFHLRF